ncbi:MAG TPA: hypothetical protein VK895_03905 [Jiangellaceae bacterium]|nr:hypothetical protein [Jiangellaceae bacterium]
MATVVAATTALALAGAAPALADHEVPELLTGNPDCEDVAEEFGIEGLVSLEKFDDVPDGTKTVDVDPADYPGYDILVIVKGGPNAHVFFEPPFHDLYAPNNVGGNQADISHYEICGVEKDETPPPTTPPGTEPPGTEPPGTEPPSTEPPSEEPDDEETPKPVPTSVPAGFEADNGSASTIGLLAFVTALAVGGAALVTRRFLKDN